MKKLAISFVTYNRPQHIQEYLEYIVKPTLEREIDIYIYDGSTNEATKKVVHNFIDKGYSHLKYFHYEEEQTIQRVNDAMLKPEAEYIWFCGDKFIVNPINYDVILDHIDRGYDIITLYNKSLDGIKYSNNCVEYLEYSLVPITLFGATIIKKSNLKEEIPLQYYNNYSGFARMRYCIDCITKKNFKGVTLHFKDLNIISRYPTKSATESRMWEIWVIQWYKMINSLPKSYNNVKDELFNAMDKRMDFFSLNQLLKQREENQFDLKMCRQNRKIVKKVICLPYFMVEAISSLTPGMAGMIRKLLEVCT